jgi:UDP-glucose 4-epimerase
MNKIVILGASGFLGKSLLTRLKKENFQIKSMIHSDDDEIKTEKVKGDILSKSFIESNLSKGDVVINLVGQYSGNMSHFISLNVIGGLNLLNSCVKKKVDRVILISTINVYGENILHPSKETDPTIAKVPYGMIKLITEKIYEHYSKTFGLDIVILRLSHVYGPDKKIGIISDLLNAAIKNKSYTLFNNGKQLRDFLYVDDAIDGITQAVKLHKKGFSIFNISSGMKYSTKDLVRVIEKITNKKMKINLSPVIPDEKCIWADYSRARKILKFKPHVSIDKGLDITFTNISKSN